jgi:hypothetical protein
MTYRIAGIDVHKRMLAVVIADVAVEGEYEFKRRKVGTSPTEMCRLAEWLVAEQVEEVVMESTAQYWRPVWATLEQQWRPKRLQEGGGPRSGQLHLAQAQYQHLSEQRQAFAAILDVFSLRVSHQGITSVCDHEHSVK